MSSYVIVGASRGLGYEWLRHLSEDSNNTVIGVVRNVGNVQSKLEADNIKSVHLLHADMADHKALNAAATKAANITGGSLDYLIVNGALVDRNSQKYQPTEFIGREEQLRKEMVESLDVNVVGVIYSINAFLPLIREGSVKKVTVISTGMADTEMVVKAGVPGSITYASMKAATNMVVAKYAVELKSESIILLALSPGLVNTRETPPTEVEMKEILPMIKSFQVAYPNFKGPITPAESVVMQKKVIENITLDQSGSFLSHSASKEWL